MESAPMCAELLEKASAKLAEDVLGFFLGMRTHS